MNIVSFFSGAGGLDLGFQMAGFRVVWANEYDREIWETYEKNHLSTSLDKRSIVNVNSQEVPGCDGIIGGPPCQSWSEAGTLRGVNDSRGQLFFDFIRIIADKQPKFFLAENVSGMLLKTHSKALNNIMKLFEECGYDLTFGLVNASDYGVPQDRKRVFFVGYRKDLGLKFEFPKPTTPEKKVTLEIAIGDIKEDAVPRKNGVNQHMLENKLSNHEFMVGDFSPIFMSRNRVRGWDEVSFTIQAGARHIPIHPQAPKMTFIEQNKREFVKGQEHLYRRLSVRECARIQTFPDDFIFYYNNIAAGYKMIGNAVPVNLAKIIACKIKTDLDSLKNQNSEFKNHRRKGQINGSMVKTKMLEILNK